MRDYTLRCVPERVEEALHKLAEERGIADEQAALELIAGALGVDVVFEYYELELLEEATAE